LASGSGQKATFGLAMCVISVIANYVQSALTFIARRVSPCVHTVIKEVIAWLLEPIFARRARSFSY